MFRRFLNLFRSSRHAAEIREELEFHRAQTSGCFGNVTRIQEQTQEAGTVVWLETLLQDLGYGFRQLRKTPVLSAVAVLSLALGIWRKYGYLLARERGAAALTAGVSSRRAVAPCQEGSIQ
jgi:hypothetical protein